LIEQGVDAMETDVQDDVAADDKMQTWSALFFIPFAAGKKNL
jgi:hypothetical protein